MFGIVVALKAEAKSLLNIAKIKKEFNLADKPAYLCEIGGKECVLAISGIGKVSAALTTQLLIDNYNLEFILNYGTCGGTNDNVKITNYYIVEKCCQYDFDLTELEDVPLGYIQEYDTVFFNTCTDKIDFLPMSTLASADKFTNKQEDIQTINQMGCSICDMEGAAIAQVCTSNSTPLYIIKGISDVAGNGTNPEQFFENLQTVGDNFPSIIIKAIKEISK